MADEPTNPPEDNTVPYHRFSELAAEKAALKTQFDVQAAEAKGWQERAAAADALQAQIEKMRGEHEAAMTGWSEERSMFAAGIADAEGHAVARTLYKTLPESSRPASIKAWLTGLAADGATVPRGLAPYLPSAAAPATPAAPAAPAAPATPTNGATPNTPPAASLAPSAPAGVTAQAVRAAVERGQRTGDWSEFKSLTGRGG